MSINAHYPWQENFGRSVAIEGDRVAVGAVPAWWHGNTTDTGAVYIFEYDGSEWVETAKLTAPFGKSAAEDGFGQAVALSGDRLYVGAMQGLGSSYVSEEGSVYVFEHDGSNWNPDEKAMPSSKDRPLTGCSCGMRSCAPSTCRTSAFRTANCP